MQRCAAHTMTCFTACLQVGGGRNLPCLYSVFVIVACCPVAGCLAWLCVTISAEDSVICPVCWKANLVELQGIIACPSGDLRLDLRTEQVGLQDLRQRLAQLLEVRTEKARLPQPLVCC